jgi:hypothetical protein
VGSQRGKRIELSISKMGTATAPSPAEALSRGTQEWRVSRPSNDAIFRRAIATDRPERAIEPERAVVHDGLMIFDSSTHVGPDAWILAGLSRDAGKGPAAGIGGLQIVRPLRA